MYDRQFNKWMEICWVASSMGLVFFSEVLSYFNEELGGLNAEMKDKWFENFESLEERILCGSYIGIPHRGAQRHLLEAIKLLKKGSMLQVYAMSRIESEIDQARDLMKGLVALDDGYKELQI
jgi:hypothetical protein